MAHMEKELSETEIYNGRILRLQQYTVELENGRTAKREIIKHHGGACVAALDDDGCLLMVRQYRFALGKELLELPAGKLEPNEDPCSAAMRELEEETGYRTERLEKLTAMAVSPGYCSEIVHIYYTTKLEPSKQHLDADEFLSVVRLPLAQAVAMVSAGEIVDGKTQLGILMLNNILNQK